MKKRNVPGVTIEPLSSSNIQLDCDDDTKFTATIPVACTHKAMYRIDEPVIWTSTCKKLLGGRSMYAGLIAHFAPDFSDMLTIKVSEVLLKDEEWENLSERILKNCLDQMDSIHEVCGGTLHIFAARFHPVDSSIMAFKYASHSLMFALQANWANGT